MDISVDNEVKNYITRKIKDQSISIQAMERPGRS